MVRFAHRTLVARFFAVCLLAFAVSPVTAPFTTCDVADFIHRQPTHSGNHPGRQLAEAGVKVAPHVVTLAPTLDTSLAARDRDGRRSIVPATAFAHARGDLRTVLRV